MRRLILLCAILASGCSTIALDKQSDGLSPSKNIAVVSLLGDDFHGIRVGTTAFGNLSYDVDVSEWNVDQTVERLLVTTLRDKNLKVSVLNLNKDERKRLVQSRSLLGYDYSNVYSIAKQQGIDILVLVNPTRYENAPFHKPGYGFFQRTFLGNSGGCIYSLFTIDFRNVTSNTQLAWEWGKPCESGERELTWREKFDDYSISEKSALKRRVEDNLEVAIPKAASEAYRRAALWKPWGGGK